MSSYLFASIVAPEFRYTLGEMYPVAPFLFQSASADWKNLQDTILYIGEPKIFGFGGFISQSKSTGIFIPTFCLCINGIMTECKMTFMSQEDEMRSENKKMPLFILNTNDVLSFVVTANFDSAEEGISYDFNVSLRLVSF
jgi:hypothetical protein